jgi:hypothetical protein
MLATTLVLQAAERAFAVQLACWLGSVIAWYSAYGPRARTPSSQPLDARDWWAVGGLILLGLATRATYLGVIPAGLYGDEADFARSALSVLHGTPPPPFATGLGFTPTLWTWIMAGGMALGGTGVGGLRLASGLGTSLAALPLYGLLRRDLGRATAIAGGVLVACSSLHIHLSRLGLSEAWLPILLPATLAALLSAVRGSEPRPYVLTGIGLALCF